jgi:hypothetical protein
VGTPTGGETNKGTETGRKDIRRGGMGMMYTLACTLANAANKLPASWFISQTARIPHTQMLLQGITFYQGRTQKTGVFLSLFQSKANFHTFGVNTGGVDKH